MLIINHIRSKISINLTKKDVSNTRHFSDTSVSGQNYKINVLGRMDFLNIIDCSILWHA